MVSHRRGHDGRLHATPAPVQAGDSCAFEVAVGDSVGVVSAIDANEDSITYSISAGNAAGKFAADSLTEEITLAESPIP